MQFLRTENITTCDYSFVVKSFSRVAACLLLPSLLLWLYQTDRVFGEQLTLADAIKKTNSSRQDKVLSIFQIVTFPNDGCVGSASRNGTCYTSEECSSRGGASSGSCADGFGVCCVFSLSCGETSSENNTYIVQSSTSSVTTPDPCVYTICPINNDICRIKFDFNTFSLSDPQLGSTTTAVTSAAVSTSIGGIGDCLTDTFTITNPGGVAPPIICGYNTGQHMILDATTLPNCHKVTFDLSGSTSSRSWDITVYQYSCSEPSDVAGPRGCLQYFTGTTGTIANFNYPTNTGTASATTTHLSNQDYSMCIRAENGFCAVCYAQAAGTAAATYSFGIGLSTTAITADNAVDTTFCDTDYLTIPGGERDSTGTMFAVNGRTEAFSKFCGRVLAAFSPTATFTDSVCSQSRPFTVAFKTDADEIGNGIASMVNADEQNMMPGGITGFYLRWVQVAC